MPHVEVPMLVFINGKCSYPIQGVPVLFQVRAIDRKKEDGWIRGYFRNGYLSQGQFANIRGAWKGILYVDNANGHNETYSQNKLLRKITTELRKFPTNATYLGSAR